MRPQLGPVSGLQPCRPLPASRLCWSGWARPGRDRQRACSRQARTRAAPSPRPGGQRRLAGLRWDGEAAPDLWPQRLGAAAVGWGGSDSWPGGLRPAPSPALRPLHSPSGEIATHLPAHGFTIAAHLPAHGLAIAAHLAARGFAPHAARTLPRRPRCLPRPQTSASPLPGGCRSPEGTSGPRPSASLTADTRGARRSPHGCPGRTAQTLPRKSAGPTGLTPEPAEGPWSPQKQPSTPTR